MRILVTGADGFAGKSLCEVLRTAGHEVTGVTRQDTGDISGQTDWLPFLQNIDVVVHLANRAHVLKETAASPLAAFRQVNVEGTRKLAQQAAKQGVKRFIYISSIGVNGRKTTGKPFDEHDTPAPHNAYATSKWEAEQALKAIGQATGMETVILRPPLIYGPGVKANFLLLLKAVNYCIPLPVGGVKNKRHLLGLENLISAIRLCITHPAAAGQTFLIADDETISTPELVCTLAAYMESPVQMFPCPKSLLHLVGRLAKREATIDGLISSLEVNNRKIKTALGWQPAIPLKEGLAKTAAWYISTAGKKLKWLKSVM